MTSSRASAMLASTVGRTTVRSPLAAFDANEKGRPSGALSHGHPAHGLAHVNQTDRAAAPSKSCLTSPCKLGAGNGRRPFHSRLVPLSSPGVWTNRPVRFLPTRIGHNSPAARHSAERGGLYSSNDAGCTQPVRNSLPHQQIPNALADVGHLSIVLSKPSSFAGSTNASKRGQGLGNFIHKRGTSIQGTGCHD